MRRATPVAFVSPDHAPAVRFCAAALAAGGAEHDGLCPACDDGDYAACIRDADGRNIEGCSPARTPMATGPHQAAVTES